MTRRHDDEEDEWPPPATDPEVLANARRQLQSMAAVRQRVLRWTYAGLAVLVILIIVLVTIR